MNELKIVKQRRKRYNTDIERKQANRTNKANYQANYRAKKKIEREKNKTTFSDAVYALNIFNAISELSFGHEITLRFNKYVSIEYASKAAIYFTEYLQKHNITNNIIYSIEYGSDRNIHIHLALNFKVEFLNLYGSDKAIQGKLHSIWNNDKVKNGAVWVRAFKSKEHKKNYLNYILKEILPLSLFHYKQKQVDLYYIQSFANNTIEQNIGFDKELTTVLSNAKIDRNSDCYKMIDSSDVLTVETLIPYVKYHYQLLAIILALIWFITV